MTAILFGSISTLADTSELQRQAFNQAFSDAGLDWNWSRDQYLAMLESSGGAGRIAAYAQSQGQTVDAAALHVAKSKNFQQSLATSRVSPREGVVDTIRGARKAGIKLGFVTTTSRANISALFEALAPEVKAADFDVIVDVADVEQPKPDPAAYRYALQQLGQDASACVAIEDNVGGAQAAAAAGLTCVAFPNQNTSGHEFDTAVLRVDRLDLETLQRFVVVD